MYVCVWLMAEIHVHITNNSKKATGGELLFIECSLVPGGRGALTITGKLGEVGGVVLGGGGWVVESGGLTDGVIMHCLTHTTHTQHHEHTTE